MKDETPVKYIIPTIFAIRGTIDPLVIAISFGMIAGWLGRVAILYDQKKPWREIMREMVISLLAGGGGALVAYGAVVKLNLDPLGAAMLAFGIAASGVKTIKIVSGGSMRIVEWLMRNIARDVSESAVKRTSVKRIHKTKNPAEKTLDD